MFSRYSDRMKARSAALLLTIDGRLHRILQAWLLIAGLAAVLRIGLTTPVGPIAEVSTAGSYLLLVFAPVASTLLALRWFRADHWLPQPRTRLARAGRRASGRHGRDAFRAAAANGPRGTSAGRAGPKRPARRPAVDRNPRWRSGRRARPGW